MKWYLCPVIVSVLLLSTPVLAQDARQAEIQRTVSAVYQLTGNRPLWVDQQGRPTADAWIALVHLRAAGEDGLAAEDYQGTQLEYEAMALSQTAAPSSIEAAAFDVRLTASTLKYLRDLHLGRADPRALGFHLDHASDPHDFGAWLHAAVAEHAFGRLVEELRPTFAQYKALKESLPAYRAGEPARARQIELAMERLRWLPDLKGRRLIVVNIPMFHVWGWDPGREAGDAAIDMAAIIGRAAATRTPVFTSRINEIVLNPYWNVPDSIMRNEILPKVARDPGYLARNHMEIVSDGRIRQLPGPWNALGRVKFAFPNPYDVFLHGTPSPELFRRDRRDFSHGCIRVEDPVGLAEWMLTGQGDWTRERIESAIAAGGTLSISVAQPPQIVVFYMTAFVPGEGTVRFAGDIYGHDARLEAWLKARAGETE